MNNKLFITVAPNISVKNAKKLKEWDFSPAGIAREVTRACNAGASIAHLHVCDESGNPTTDTDVFKKTISLIRESCNIVIEGSTGGLNSLSAKQRAVALETDIELASLNPGSVNYNNDVYINSPADIAYWIPEMHKQKIKADITVFEPGMIENTMLYAQKNLLSSPFLFTFVLGLNGAMPATPKNLLFLSESIPAGSFWCSCGQNGSDLQMDVLAMNMGGNVRAGFEDNPYYKPGVLAQSNAQLIERLVRITHEVGREIASPDEVRQLLKLI